MENASKALIIAGGVLLAIITLSLLVYVFTTMERFAEAQDERTLAEQITVFNKGYEAYNKRRMYGTDVITVVNKAKEDNMKYEDSKVTVVILDVEGKSIISDISYDSEFKNSIFECTEFNYNATTGKVAFIKFQKIK